MEHTCACCLFVWTCVRSGGLCDCEQLLVGDGIIYYCSRTCERLENEPSYSDDDDGDSAISTTIAR